MNKEQTHYGSGNGVGASRDRRGVGIQRGGRQRGARGRDGLEQLDRRRLHPRDEQGLELRGVGDGRSRGSSRATAATRRGAAPSAGRSRGRVEHPDRGKNGRPDGAVVGLGEGRNRLGADGRGGAGGTAGRTGYGGEAAMSNDGGTADGGGTWTLNNVTIAGNSVTAANGAGCQHSAMSTSAKARRWVQPNRAA